MSRTLEELDQKVTVLEREVEALKRQKSAMEHPIRKLAGSLHVDQDLQRILDDLDLQRSQPDPDLQGTA